MLYLCSVPGSFDGHSKKVLLYLCFQLTNICWPSKGMLTVYISCQVTTRAADRWGRSCGLAVTAGVRDPTRRPPSLHPQAGIPPAPQEPTSTSTPECSVTSQCSRCVLILKKCGGRESFSFLKIFLEDISPFLWDH